MWATISTSPRASSTAIATTRPSPFVKSISERGSMGGRRLPARQGGRQTLAERRELVEARAAREARLGLVVALRADGGALEHAEPHQEVGGVRKGDRVRGLAPLRLAEQHRAREVLLGGAAKLLRRERLRRRGQHRGAGGSVGLDHRARLRGEEAQRAAAGLAPDEASVAPLDEALAFEIVEEGVEALRTPLARREELGVEEVEPAV